MKKEQFNFNLNCEVCLLTYLKKKHFFFNFKFEHLDVRPNPFFLMK